VVELADRVSEAAWKIRHLEDYEGGAEVRRDLQGTRGACAYYLRDSLDEERA
jgi:hypothetical protein